MTRASEFSKKMRARIFERSAGKCEKCGAILKVGEGEYDHVIPLALGGESTLDNAELLCVPCHRGEGGKTADDVSRIAKAKRTSAKHNGISKPAGNIKSRGFAKADKPEKIGKAVLPPRPMFQKRGEK